MVVWKPKSVLSWHGIARQSLSSHNVKREQNFLGSAVWQGHPHDDVSRQRSKIHRMDKSRSQAIFNSMPAKKEKLHTSSANEPIIEPKEWLSERLYYYYTYLAFALPGASILPSPSCGD